MALTLESLREIMREGAAAAAKAQGLKPLRPEHQAVIDAMREKNLEIMARLIAPPPDPRGKANHD